MLWIRGFIPVQKYVRQRWVRPHVRDALMNNDHDERSESKHKKDIDGTDDCLPHLRVQSARHLLPVPPVGVRVTHRVVCGSVSVPQPQLTPVTRALPSVAPRVGRAAAPLAPRREPGWEAQLLQPGLVPSLEPAEGYDQPLDVSEHTEAQRRAAQVGLGQSQQAGAVQAVLVAQQLHVLPETFIPKPQGHLLTAPGAHNVL